MVFACKQEIMQQGDGVGAFWSVAGGKVPLVSNDRKAEVDCAPLDLRKEPLCVTAGSTHRYQVELTGHVYLILTTHTLILLSWVKCFSKAQEILRAVHQLSQRFMKTFCPKGILLR